MIKYLIVVLTILNSHAYCAQESESIIDQTIGTVKNLFTKQTPKTVINAQPLDDPQATYDINNLLDKSIKIGAVIDNKNIDYSLANLLCIYLNKEYNNQGINCYVFQEQSFSKAVDRLENASLDIILLPGIFQNNLNQNMRFVSSLYDEQFFIFTQKNQNINNLSDLSGKMVGINQNDSLENMIMNDVMSNSQQLKLIQNINDSDLMKYLCGSRLNAIVLTGETANANISLLSKSCEIDVVNLNSNIFTALTGTGKYKKSIIKGGTYNGLPFDINTIATPSTIISSNKVEPIKIYLLLETIVKNLNNIKKTNSALQDLDINTLKSNQILPMHQGATHAFTKLQS